MAAADEEEAAGDGVAAAGEEEAAEDGVAAAGEEETAEAAAAEGAQRGIMPCGPALRLRSGLSEPSGRKFSTGFCNSRAASRS